MMKFLQYLLLYTFISPLLVQAQEDMPDLVTQFVFEVRAEISPPDVMGLSSDGVRQAIPITGGDISGPGIKGVVVPGGADYQTQRPDGVTEVEAIYMIRTDDGVLINVRNEGIIVPGVNAAAAYVRTTPRFKAPVGKYDWLNKYIFLSNLVVKPERPGMVFVQIYKVL